MGLTMQSGEMRPRVLRSSSAMQSVPLVTPVRVLFGGHGAPIAVGRAARGVAAAGIGDSPNDTRATATRPTTDEQTAERVWTITVGSLE